jgi:hypothetical protein
LGHVGHRRRAAGTAHRRRAGGRRSAVRALATRPGGSVVLARDAAERVVTNCRRVPARQAWLAGFVF